MPGCEPATYGIFNILCKLHKSNKILSFLRRNLKWHLGILIKLQKKNIGSTSTRVYIFGSLSFEGFEKFVTAAEAWPGDAQYDIVEGFLRSSSECSEIFHILEAGKRKVQEV